jgi:hypothetical protein
MAQAAKPQHNSPARSNIVGRLRPVKQTESRYTVVEAAFNGERVVLETDDRENAYAVAGQHAARRVMEE